MFSLTLCVLAWVWLLAWHGGNITVSSQIGLPHLADTLMTAHKQCGVTCFFCYFSMLKYQQGLHFQSGELQIGEILVELPPFIWDIGDGLPVVTKQEKNLPGKTSIAIHLAVKSPNLEYSGRQSTALIVLQQSLFEYRWDWACFAHSLDIYVRPRKIYRDNSQKFPEEL